MLKFFIFVVSVLVAQEISYNYEPEQFYSYGYDSADYGYELEEGLNVIDMGGRGSTQGRPNVKEFSQFQVANSTTIDGDFSTETETASPFKTADLVGSGDDATITAQEIMNLFNFELPTASNSPESFPRPLLKLSTLDDTTSTKEFTTFTTQLETSTTTTTTTTSTTSTTTTSTTTMKTTTYTTTKSTTTTTTLFTRTTTSTIKITTKRPATIKTLTTRPRPPIRLSITPKPEPKESPIPVSGFGTGFDFLWDRTENAAEIKNFLASDETGPSRKKKNKKNAHTANKNVAYTGNSQTNYNGFDSVQTGRVEVASFSCWSCSRTYWDANSSGDVYADCRANGKMEVCSDFSEDSGSSHYASGTSCQITERRFFGIVTEIHTGCKQTRACKNNFIQNRMTASVYGRSCRPETSMGISTCRQCCAADGCYDGTNLLYENFDQESEWFDETAHSEYITV